MSLASAFNTNNVGWDVIITEAIFSKMCKTRGHSVAIMFSKLLPQLMHHHK